MSKLSPLTVLALSVLVSPALAQIGSVVRAQKLNEVSGGIVGPIPTLGYALAALGDVNGDGVGDLVAGLPTDNGGGPHRGALLVLFLNPNGTVARQQKISQLAGGFTGSLVDDGYFGIAASALGDLDGDGLQELAVRTDLPRGTWILSLSANGTVRAQHQILWSDPVFGGTTKATDFDAGFVRGLTGMGDLDGDGVGDLAVGAPGDDDGDPDAGAIWFLYLKPDGTAKAAKKISQTSGGLGDVLAERSGFGQAFARLGDLNGDGFADLSACEFGGGHHRWVLFLDAQQNVLGTSFLPLTEELDPIGDLDGDGRAEFASEGFDVRFLAADGHPRKTLLVRGGRNGMPSDPAMRSLGTYSFAALGDLDGDGTLELAVCDYGDVQSGGAVWILSLARTPVLAGSGANPLILSESAEPALGHTWSASLDCSGHASGVAALVGYQRALAGTFVAGGELLVDTASPRFFLLLTPHAGAPVAISAAVPNDVALVSVQLYAQGLCAGAPGLTLSNALGLLIGN